VLFVNLGQSPRDDVVPEIVAQIGHPIDVVEVGLLDGLSDDEMREAAVGADSGSTLRTRLRDGRPVVISRAWANRRIAEIDAQLVQEPYDVVVLLSTGELDEFSRRGLFVSAQRVVDTWIDAIAMTGQTIGLLLPLPAQKTGFSIDIRESCRIVTTNGRPESPEELDRAALRLKDCDLIVLHSLEYDERSMRRVAAASGRPVVLARRVTAGALRMLLTQRSRVQYPVEMETAGLTRRERQVMSLMVEGLSNKAIARELGISHRTVEIHRANVMSKMGVSSLSALIRMALLPRL
jgi:DNA-binding CsgD family transcriptional regulator